MRRNDGTILLPGMALAMLAWAGAARAEEPVLLKPVGGSGSGAITDGLQAAVKAVKAEFGPGESVLLQWTIANVGKRKRVIHFGKSPKYYNFQFEARNGGRKTKLWLVWNPKAFNGLPRTLAPGEKIRKWIDLGALPLNHEGWFNAKGRYEVAVIYKGTKGKKAVRSGWATFKRVASGTPRRPEDPKLAERIETLIAKLGHDDFRVREEAQKALIAIGVPALGLVKEAAKRSADAEVRLRCKKIVSAIHKQRRERYLRERRPPNPPRPRPLPRPQPQILRPRPVPGGLRPAPPPPPRPRLAPPDEEF